MSEVSDLKRKITEKLDSISDRYQLRTIHKMMDRLEELEKHFKYEEQATSRGVDLNFFRNEIDMEQLPSESDDQGESLKSLIGQAFSLLEAQEQKRS